MNKLTSIHINVLFIHSQNSFHLCSIRLNWFFIMFSCAFLKSACTLFSVHRKQTTTKDTTTLNMTHWHRISSSRKSVCLKRAIFMTNCEGYQRYSADTAYIQHACAISSSIWSYHSLWRGRQVLTSACLLADVFLVFKVAGSSYVWNFYGK